ncbi:MAG: LysM peptidoglycan-binding domain-containing protein [Phototrophicales bacterium]|nr:LysM peptidoglycan-binding domain-containing protein [Phototrophicales bacterium]
MRQFIKIWMVMVCLLYGVVACSLGDNSPQVVYITATPPLFQQPTTIVSMPTAPPSPIPTRMVVVPSVGLSPVPVALNITQTPNPSRFDLPPQGMQQHIVVAGDTLSTIAERYGTTLDSLLAENELLNPNILSIGQIIQLPQLPTELTPAFKILPDSRVVRASNAFDVAGFIAQQGGFLRGVTDEVDSRQFDGSTVKQTLTATQVIERVSIEYSIDPRLLLVLLEYRAGWLSNTTPSQIQRTFPLIYSLQANRLGLYRQLSWAAYHLNVGYYGWKQRGLTTLEFETGERFLYDAGLNAGTVALQYLFSLSSDVGSWRGAITTPQGFFALYYAYFGNPFEDKDPIIPSNLIQPDLGLPFASGEVWFFTGGAHGGWATSSAWSALDFAPPDERTDGLFCFVSQYWVRAVADGVIARSQEGGVWLDLDNDGDDSTGWVIFYLHIATQDRAPVGMRVKQGDPIGRASCEGGYSTATHLHIARKYNGEWIPTDCPLCATHDARPVFNLGGWRVVSIPNQEYQGYLDFNGQRLTAEQGRLSVINRISW